MADDSKKSGAKDGSKRRPGGQPGNSNALRHGFYSRSFRQTEYEDLEGLQLSLESEIAGARVIARRLFDAANSVDDPLEAVPVMQAFGSTLVKIAGLVRTQAILVGKDDASASISTAIQEVIEEMKGDGRIVF